MISGVGIRKKGKEEFKLKDLYKTLSECDPTSRAIDDEKLDQVISILLKQVKSWRNMYYASKILGLIIEADMGNEMRNKLYEKQIIPLLFSLFSADIHKNDDLRQNILDCLFYMSALPATHEDIVSTCNGINVLYDYYKAQGSAPHETLAGIRVLRIFKAIVKAGKFKDAVMECGIERSLVRQSHKLIPTVDTSKKYSFYKNKGNTDRIWSPRRDVLDKSSKKAESLLMASQERQEYDSMNEESVSTKPLSRRSASSTEEIPDAKLLASLAITREGRAQSDTRGRAAKIPSLVDEIPIRNISPRRNRSRKKSDKSRVYSQNKEKIRVKCRWEEDLRFIWVEKNIAVKELTEVIEREYTQQISIGMSAQLKYCDPSNQDDLMTITKREDLDLCFEHDKPEIYIITASVRSTSPSPTTIPKSMKPVLPLAIPVPTTPKLTASSGNVDGLNTPYSGTTSARSPQSSSRKTGRENNNAASSVSTPKSPPSPVKKTASARTPGVRREHTDGQESGRNTGRSLRNKQQHEKTLNTEQHKEDLTASAEITISTPKGSQKKRVPESLQALEKENPRWIISSSDLKINEDALGVGYFGEVRLGIWRGITVACKFVYEKSFRRKSDLELFEQEVTILSSLRHPNVILYMGVCLDNYHQKIIVMEYMEKGSLHELVRTEQLEIYQIHKIAKEIALGMNYLHGENILHRDLTSKNILLSKHMEAKVADFGLSKMKLTQPETYSYTMGSVAWMAPEVLAHAKNFTTVSDVYSYAIVLWELWTGEDPCPRETAPVNLANKVLHEDRRPDMEEHIPDIWKSLIQKCWQREPESRPNFERVLQILDTFDPEPQKDLRSSRTDPLQPSSTLNSSRRDNEADDDDNSNDDDSYAEMLGAD